MPDLAPGFYRVVFHIRANLYGVSQGGAVVNVSLGISPAAASTVIRSTLTASTTQAIARSLQELGATNALVNSTYAQFTAAVAALDSLTTAEQMQIAQFLVTFESILGLNSTAVNDTVSINGNGGTVMMLTDDLGMRSTHTTLALTNYFDLPLLTGFRAAIARVVLLRGRLAVVVVAVTFCLLSGNPLVAGLGVGIALLELKSIFGQLGGEMEQAYMPVQPIQASFESANTQRRHLVAQNQLALVCGVAKEVAITIHASSVNYETETVSWLSTAIAAVQSVRSELRTLSAKVCRLSRCLR